MNLEEARQKKQRGVTVKELLDQNLGLLDQIESIVIVTQLKDGSIGTGYSYHNSLEALGMLSVAETDVKDSMRA